MAPERVIIVGAGMGGLAAAADLARQGIEVLVCEKAGAVGGKMRRVAVQGALIDAGPTVFTMRWVFEQLFADAGARLTDHLDLLPAEILARHFWRQGGQLDLFADPARSEQAIGSFAGAKDAQGFRAFCARSRAIYQTLEAPFMAAEKPSPLELVRRAGWRQIPALARTDSARSLWTGLGDFFSDPRLRQLFGRYATYVGASPWLAPATLMLIAHVEQQGVWLVRGGINRVAAAIQALAERQGARFRFHCPVAEILTAQGRVSGVRLEDGEELRADAVLFNGDVAALPGNLSPAKALRPAQRSLSALTWCVKGRVGAFPLVHHNVFFAEDYRDEFEAIFRRREVTARPTVYLCAQDRGDQDGMTGGEERFLALINAPADGDVAPFSEQTKAMLQRSCFGLMRECGLNLEFSEQSAVITGPAEFHALFPATGGALYGRANHGAMGSFQRAGTRGAIAGLYLAGGSVHPGAGIPMATLSGRLAAARLLQDFAATASRRRSVAVPVRR